MKKILAVFIAVLSVFLVARNANAAKPTDKGFDSYGYNRTARNFVGTCKSWYLGKFVGSTDTQAEAYCGDYSNDKLVMKWNAEWDRGNAENWANPPYDAWENNEWNGAFPGGSGSIWHYKIAWDQGCYQGSEPSNEGGYCLWGPFAVLMDQGKDPAYGPGHLWFAHITPNGYGAY